MEADPESAAGKTERFVRPRAGPHDVPDHGQPRRGAARRDGASRSNKDDDPEAAFDAAEAAAAALVFLVCKGRRVLHLPGPLQGGATRGRLAALARGSSMASSRTVTPATSRRLGAVSPDAGRETRRRRQDAAPTTRGPSYVVAHVDGVLLDRQAERPRAVPDARNRRRASWYPGAAARQSRSYVRWRTPGGSAFASACSTVATSGFVLGPGVEERRVHGDDVVKAAEPGHAARRPTPARGRWTRTARRRRPVATGGDASPKKCPAFSSPRCLRRASPPTAGSRAFPKLEEPLRPLPPPPEGGAVTVTFRASPSLRLARRSCS